MAILLIGPSGIGKSTAMKAVCSATDGFHFVILDDAARDLGRQRNIISRSQTASDLWGRLGTDNRFLDFGIEALGLIEMSAGIPLVVDVGAGFLEAENVKLIEWFAQHTLVTMMAHVDVAYSRIKKRPQERRSLSAYSQCEYREKRCQLYEAAQVVIDVSGDEASVADQLLKQLLRIGGSRTDVEQRC